MKGTWARPNLTTPATFKDAAGRVVLLTRGRTWIELVPAGTLRPDGAATKEMAFGAAAAGTVD